MPSDRARRDARRPSLFDDDPEAARRVRTGDWSEHRANRSPRSGPPIDEVGVPVLASFVLARTDDVVVAVREVTAYSDGLRLSVVVLFSDAQGAEDLGWAMRDHSRSPGRFRFGCGFADGRQTSTGRRDVPEVEVLGDTTPSLLLRSAAATALTWTGEYWLWPLPPPGPLLLGVRWPDRGIPETLAQVDAEPLLRGAQSSRSVWEPAVGVQRTGPPSATLEE